MAVRVPGRFDLLALHAANPARYPHLLESVAHDTPRARYDILFAFPGETLILDSERRLHLDGQTQPGDFLETFDRLWSRERVPEGQRDLPFTGGWFVFLGYELAMSIEPAVGELPVDPQWPIATAVRIPAAIIYDHQAEQAWLVCEKSHEHLLAPMQADLASPALPPEESIALSECNEEEPARFLDGVRRVLDYIRAGDVFQVNLSRVWNARLERALPAWKLYQRLRQTNPAPFAGLVTLSHGQGIISSSPERLVSVTGQRVSTRPIAGTHPRGKDSVEDRALAGQLLKHPKERAEHIMLIDLERNDLGRICRPGSVRVDELMSLETYRHVHHIVSEVAGLLRDGVTPGEVIRAVFPGGTITGCPKVRCMQIIRELEAAPRAAYTGSMGYVNRDGSMDLNILIRTLWQREDRIQWRAGAGIVADSNPERELNETRVKARGLQAALSS
ncbi:MAG: aminodeoxychorismate synthase, component I [Candidatus Muproteobacteria bacterium RBG_16_62_13]|uniref:Aminodeoxychorismate synthase, component I n=1 Tax=Candidatus Muproteobacteria bacterium RBG_16_62_13 TaxID=1817756 RepID=A0A1F6SYK6_9PROT|nr:MAG: aminodeoxychorismate synthase, component I [Candidatus Muproteobacteria bacterium RBG_16_62_13]